jgi:hypothetical protein
MTQSQNVKSQPLQTQYEASQHMSESWEEHEFLSIMYGWLYHFTLSLLQAADFAGAAFLSPIAYVSEVWIIIARMDAEATSKTDVARILLEEIMHQFGDIEIPNGQDRIDWMADSLWRVYTEWLRSQNSQKSVTLTRAGALLTQHGKREQAMRSLKENLSR